MEKQNKSIDIKLDIKLYEARLDINKNKTSREFWTCWSELLDSVETKTLWKGFYKSSVSPYILGNLELTDWMLKT